MKQIKMLWDFRGPKSKQTADHHCIHLNEFFEREQIKPHKVGVELYSDSFCSAIAVVDEQFVDKCREVLKPNRGQLFE